MAMDTNTGTGWKRGRGPQGTFEMWWGEGRETCSMGGALDCFGEFSLNPLLVGPLVSTWFLVMWLNPQNTCPSLWQVTLGQLCSPSALKA